MLQKKCHSSGRWENSSFKNQPGTCSRKKKVEQDWPNKVTNHDSPVGKAFEN